MKVLIAIDDTDNKESRGTGYMARQLREYLAGKDMGSAVSISRHQLFFDPRVPYTSHNSSLCIYMESDTPLERLFEETKEFVAAGSAPGSDPGACVANEESINNEIISFGFRAKSQLMTQGEARLLARENGIFLEGLGGTEDGVIGCVAAIGLRASGIDGRCPWVPGMRELPAGSHSAEAILSGTGITGFLDVVSEELVTPETIELNESTRAIMMNGLPTLLVEEEKNGQSGNCWRAADKPHVKRY